uniref:Uncharacterized protein n=1 Tax=Arundo donax TaxID=35708 RepID=A0A0A8Y987_ARUDO
MQTWYKETGGVLMVVVDYHLKHFHLKYFLHYFLNQTTVNPD